MISGSLGSRILYEYLIDTQRPTAHLVDSVLVNTDKIFMLTNQLRLLGLKEIPAELNVAKYDSLMFLPFEKRLNQLDSDPKHSVNIELIAFNDPNDLLGYKFIEIEGREHQPYCACEDGDDDCEEREKRINMVSCSVHNARTIPWFASWPADAHSKTWKNRRIAKILTKGGAAKK